MSVLPIFHAIFDTIRQVLTSINSLTLSNGVLSVGFFTIMIGFIILNILIANFRK